MIRPSGKFRKYRFARLALLPALVALLAAPGPARSQGLPPGPAVPAAPPEALAVEAPLGPCPGASGAWVPLSEIPWAEARTGWPAVADVVLPEQGVSFSRNPLVVAGQTYADGLGTYPLTEVIYDLQERYSGLRATVGLNDDAPPEAAAVFLVYADGVLVYSSGLVRRGEPGRPLELCLAGVRRLRLVSAAAGAGAALGDGFPPDHNGSYADWVEARLFRPEAPDASAAGAVRDLLGRSAAGRRARVVGELGVYREAAEAGRQAVAGALGLPPAGDWPGAAQAGRDADGRLVLAHRRLALVLGFGGSGHAGLTVLRPAEGAGSSGAQPVWLEAGSAVVTAKGTLDLHRDTEPAAPDAFRLGRVEDPGLGPGAEVRATFRVRAAPAARVEVRVVLFDDRPQFTYQVVLSGWPAASLGAPQRLDYLGAAGPALVLGDGARYVADAGYVREGELADDGLWRSARLGIGKPAVLWGEAVPGASGTPGASGAPGAAPGAPGNGPGSVVLALLDEQRLPAWLVARRDPGRAGAAAGVAQPLPADGASGDGLEGPRLSVEVAPTTDLRLALARYREVTAARYPPPPLPEWVRHQWGSWWVYGSAVDEAKLRAQIDVIAGQLSDLGPWHILIDGGWQDTGAGGTGDLGRPSPQRFPNGLKPLVDYAHARGIRVILFASPVFAHDERDRAEWLALPGLLTRQPDWFRPLTPPGGTAGRYLFDYARPGTRDYLTGVVRRMVEEHGADGIKLDGLGDVEGEIIPFGERATHLPQRWALTPVMDVYRLVAQTLRQTRPDAFLESGWVNPAQAFAHTFRFGDEWDVFDREYPFPGLAQHFAYAAVQRSVLGQRAHVGAVFGGLNRPVADQWLGAALALGAQVGLGSDLTFLTPDGLAGLRALLVHHRPFAGTTRTGGEGFGLHPTWAATTAGDLTFVALLNESPAPRTMTLDLATAGLPLAPGETALAYDVAGAGAARVGASLTAEAPGQSLRLFVLRRTQGVVWTTSGYEEQPLGPAGPAGSAGPGWRVRLSGPRDVPGRLNLNFPGGPPAAVLLDGAPLAPDEGYTYDAATGLLEVRYAHAGLVPGGENPVRTLDVRR